MEQCLQRYPGQARELEPLLRIAVAAREASSGVEPRPEFKVRTRLDIQSRLRAREQKKGAVRGSPIMGWMPRWAVAVVSVVFVLILAGTSTVAASTDALPGDTLYGVKTASEEVQLKLTSSQEGKARLQARFAERRAWEMSKLAESGRTDGLRAVATRFGEHLAQLEELAARIEAADPASAERIATLRETLYASLDRDLSLLEEAEAKAPPRAASAIAVAKFRLTQRYEKAIAVLDRLEYQHRTGSGSAGSGAGAGSEGAAGSGPEQRAGANDYGQQGQTAGTGLRE